MRLSDIEGIRRLREAMGEPPGDIYWHDRQVDVQMMAEEAILEGINECLSQVGFSVIRKPRSNASSGTDPWDR
jgi:hypothetical protein